MKLRTMWKKKISFSLIFLAMYVLTLCSFKKTSFSPNGEDLILVVHNKKDKFVWDDCGPWPNRSPLLVRIAEAKKKKEEVVVGEGEEFIQLADHQQSDEIYTITSSEQFCRKFIDKKILEGFRPIK